MNLSVKLITVLAAFVLLVVGLVALTMSGSSASAADVDGKVYVANEWSKLTNDPTPLSGYKYAGSGKTIYTTFVEVNDPTAVAQNTIQTLSDTVTIFVEDKDVNIAVAKTVAVTGNMTGSVTANATKIVILASADSPIVDSDGDGLVSDDVTVVTVPANAAVITGATPGGAGVSGTVSLIATSTQAVTSVTLSWNTSQVNTLIVTVKTTQDTTGKTRTLTETGA
ncbi:MAG: hypothetical protein VB860_01550, partial [Dehalococcoidia bacterium]